MTLKCALRAWTAPMAQVRRSHDGIRGMVAKSRFHRGDLLICVPLAHCYFPHASRDPHRLRRWNRSALFPEAQFWLRQLSPDAPDARVSLCASVSTEDNKVLTLTLSPVEAALAVSVALRYFWRNVVLLKDREGSGRPALGPARFRPADLYLHSLPMEEYISYGLEGPYFSNVEDESNVHSNIEQIAWNLRDCILSHAPQEEYTFYDARPSELDATLLAAIYVIRARLLRMTAFFGEDKAPDRVTSVIAPIVDFLNHSSTDYTCAACMSIPKRAVVVRAVRDIDFGEELTLDYRAAARQRKNKRQKTLGISDLEEEEDGWEPRYLFSAKDA
ncbi:hypothetical protein C3747_138g57 [Trypanosoma cruzi]|uniref:SET domain-containing protein n=2 Tax=Trypanosoma cruzi TaxID=5693 RepID=Q4DXI3_TRYCC|nr:hypothetical protein, conserved [Trypanosoma cruzi]EAN97231.1 hypothetical protein, conserved [Trypanosoma cruzi]PWV05099.1 hypothetical protein C3747_138g57 [Trypanosoma cruzi]RNC57142.1 hypothetical protein TcCL_ESM05280 [Trypanosoma cruzi]|eukprot:XP_819082.1 hypothetical protein [Trypanosoma cruzi strain CL Brener]